MRARARDWLSAARPTRAVHESRLLLRSSTFTRDLGGIVRGGFDFAEPHDDVLVHQQARAGHETQQLAIYLALLRILDAATIEEPREARDEWVENRREKLRAELAPAAPERIHAKANSPGDPMQVVEAHHVPVASVRDSVAIRERRAAALVIAAQQIV